MAFNEVCELVFAWHEAYAVAGGPGKVLSMDSFEYAAVSRCKGVICKDMHIIHETCYKEFILQLVTDIKEL
jgi:hypothetical protein